MVSARLRPSGEPRVSTHSPTSTDGATRLDVPARAKESAAPAKDTAVESYRESPPMVIGGAVALAELVVGLVILCLKRAASNVPRTRRKR